MLLTELTGVKSFAKLTAKEIISILDGQFGIKEVGRGSFGIVLTHPGWNYVIKFFAKDDCYIKFVDYCIKNKSNEHLPKFIKKPVQLTTFFKHPQGIDSFWAVKVEKLDPLDDDSAQITDIFCDNHFVNRYKDAKDKDDFLKNFKTSIGLRGPNLLPYKKLVETIVDLSSNIIDSDCFVDIHDGNIMLRGKTPVILDPFADSHMDEAKTTLSICLYKILSNRKDLVSRKISKDELEDAASSIAKSIK